MTRDHYECEACGEEITYADSERHESWHADSVVVSREGSRGHYLVACFLSDASDLVRDKLASRDAFATDTIALRVKVEEWEALSEAYDTVYDIHSEWEMTDLPAGLDLDAGETRETVEENLSQWCHDAANDAELALGDLGYSAWWNDGYVIEATDGAPWVPTRTDGPLVGEYVSVRGHGGVAWYVDTDDAESSIVAHMVGDDRTFTFDRDDATLLPRESFCGECGQIGCEHDGYDREETGE